MTLRDFPLSSSYFENIYFDNSGLTGIDLHGFGDPERIVIGRASELIGLEFLLNVTMPTPTFNETNIPNVFVSNDFSTARSDTKIKVMNYQIALLLLPLTLAVSGCAAVAVIETAVDVAATGMKLTANAAGAAIKATGAAADALIPDTKKADPDPRIISNPN